VNVGSLALHGGSGENGWQTWDVTLATVRGWADGGRVRWSV